MAKYQKYAEYQDSGVEWLGEIPKSWQVKKLKYLCKVTTGSKDTVNSVEDGKYPFFVRSQTVERINSIGADCEAVLTAGDGVGVGKVYHYYKGKFDFHQRVYMLYDFGAVTGRFVYYYLSSNFYKVALEGNAKSTVDSLRLPQFLNFEFSLPTVKEQNHVVDFLDHETAKIDTLIAKQEKLIELLKEKRQAVISHAVTKGLNPNVPMKDSGVEWLGEVPESWEVRQLRYLGTCQNGINIGAEYFGSGSPFISYGDVYRNPELPSKFEGLVQSTENDRKIYSLKRGDVLFTRTSETIEEIGFSSTCLTDVENATFAGFLIRFRPLEAKLLPEYSKFYFRNLLLRAFFVKEMNLVTRASLSQELLKKLPVMLPSIEEQERISDFLRDKDQVFNRLINRSNEQIILLKERRTALISAAVTGKIDVRNWQHPNQKNNNNTELSA
ncbi:restriction endonuclease subunit S [Acinetobacter baumannii]|uniref:restriction endonuclease subunit S n=1 Tax=Acinetobacter baumannii TaxID=470 RepID=UPI0024B6DBCB|nr:restriction endonuclease subunit S [Acinetobacter baumannii]MDI9751060.1 restriction endonuclease subunit S [Acinetobacter baumannii]